MSGAARWSKWDADLRRGLSPADLLPLLVDEDILSMLRCPEGRRRDYERDLLIVELGNRVARLRRMVEQRPHQP